LLAGLVGGGAAQPAQAQRGDPLARFDAWLDTAMQEWNVPGVAVAVVKNDSVVLARGYGVREVGRGERVDSTTVFGIMSMTKAFTATTMGMLVDEGIVQWDDRVVDHLPDFALYDPWVTREVRIRDLLSHRMGVERGDFLWFGTGYDRDQIVRHLRYLDRVAGFRDEYGYSNNMFITAGQLMAAVTGMSWDDVIRQRIFEPLGMSSSATSIWELAEVTNRASPHEELNGELQPIPYRSLDNEAPGGSITSTVMDMARWIRFQLGGGEIDGRRLISRATLRETHAAQTPIPIDSVTRRLNPGIHFSAYAFGWQVQDYRGRKLIQHSGGIDGQRSRIALMPEEGLGIVVLTNRGQQNSLFDVIRNRILDAYLGAPAVDWSAEFQDVVRRGVERAAAEERRVREERVRGTQPSLPLERYAGSYLDDAYGEGRVSVDGDALVLEIGPEIRGRMEHWHYDTFQIVFDYAYLGEMLGTFQLGSDGDVVGLELPGWWPKFRKVHPPLPVVGGPSR
jgi:CubicO group peptidase (beta-lactamase class C family)